jgi:L-threonylcarbamoyladenylate synthase
MRPTITLAVNTTQPEPEIIAQAAAVLRGGGLVAFPTETVYGLGANALDAAAVRRIFAAKGRPANNPLIVHVADLSQVHLIAAAWPAPAAQLAERFWPGPLTLVLPRLEALPNVVTAGGPTVAVRMPAHPVARALIVAAHVPLAAPSANRSSGLSPTRADHVRRDLDGRVELILDSGPTTGGIESTVLDMTTRQPRLLRPGLITPEQIRAVVGPIESNVAAAASPHASLPSPGMLARHYAPRTPLELASGDSAAVVKLHNDAGRRVGWLALSAPPPVLPAHVAVRVMSSDPDIYASKLYAALHEFDDAGLDLIVVDLPPDTTAWLAVRDRLQRAAAR